MPSTPAKQEKQEKQSPLQRFISLWKLVPGGALLFAVVPLILLTYLGWYYYGASHIDQAFYAVRKEHVSLTPQPPWIRSSVLDQVFDSAKLDRLSLLDPKTCATIAQAFDASPWVKTTTRVTKEVGGKVLVDVVYRRPLAMVFYKLSVDPASQSGAPTATEQGFFPVDEDGILLPTHDNFGEEDLKQAKYFLIYADGATPHASDFGMPFGDQRVTEALKLCTFLEPVRERLQLHGVIVEQAPRVSGRSPLVFRLVTAGNKQQIRWGHAPGSEGVGEPTAQQKLQTLTNWLTEQLSSSSPAAQLDLLAVGPPPSTYR